MIKQYCDKCGKEISKSYNAHKFEVAKHISEPNGCGYVDSEWNDVSGTVVSYDLCNKCYNEVMGAAWKEFIKN